MKTIADLINMHARRSVKRGAKLKDATDRAATFGQRLANRRERQRAQQQQAKRPAVKRYPLKVLAPVLKVNPWTLRRIARTQEVDPQKRFTREELDFVAELLRPACILAQGRQQVGRVA